MGIFCYGFFFADSTGKFRVRMLTLMPSSSLCFAFYVKASRKKKLLKQLKGQKKDGMKVKIIRRTKKKNDQKFKFEFIPKQHVGHSSEHTVLPDSLIENLV